MELKDVIHRIMIAFVDVCATLVSLIGGNMLSTIVTITKLTLFDNDSGIRAQLDTFKVLAHYQSRISEVVALEHVLKAECDTSHSFRDVFSMLNDASENRRKQLQLLQDTNEDVKSIKAGQETLVKEVIEKTHEKKLREKFEDVCERLSTSQNKITPEGLPDFDQQDWKQPLLPESGSWIKENETYKLWANTESDYASPLILSGANGSGKSTLAWTICNVFRSRLSLEGGISTHIPIASYDFVESSKKDKKSSSSENNDILRNAIKSMAAQIAKSPDFAFLTKLTSKLTSKLKMDLSSASLSSLLKELFPFSGTKDSPSMRFVLLFDSLDELTPSVAKQLFQAILDLPPSRARVILTGTPEIFELYQNVDQNTSSIRVENQNELDVKAFIGQQLGNQKVLQGDGPQYTELIDRIRKKLWEIANGNFDKVSQFVNRITEVIESKVYLDDIDGLISDVDTEDPNKLVVANLEELNTNLSNQEIEQLNSLLSWVLCAYEEMTIPFLTAAVLVRTKHALVQNLEDKITERYGRLLRIVNETSERAIVRFRTSELLEYILNSRRRKRSTEQNEHGNTDPSITMSIQIENVPLSQVRRFFWDLNRQILMEKFPLPVAKGSSGSAVQVGVNKIDSDLLITNQCFDILLEPWKEETSELSSYALMNLLDHLETLREAVINIEVHERTTIIDNLITLFQTADVFKQHLTVSFLDSGAWLHRGIRIIQDWLRDSEATQSLHRNLKGWCRRATENALLPLREIAIRIAHLWLWDRSWPASTPYAWINIYILRLEELEKASTSNDDGSVYEDVERQKFEDKDYSDNDFTRGRVTAASRIEKTAEWAFEANGLEKNSLYYERLGLTCRWYDDYEKSKEAILKARDCPDSDWMIIWHLAHAYSSLGEIDLAVKEMETALTFQRNKTDPRQGELKGICSKI